MESRRDAVAQIVLNAVVTVFRIKEPSTINETTTADDVDGWDSLSHTVLLMQIEKTLGYDLPLEKTYAASNLGDLIDIAASAH